MTKDENVQFGSAPDAEGNRRPRSIASDMIRQLEALLDRTGHLPMPAAPEPRNDADDYLKVAKRRSSERRERERLFGPSMGEAAWDILLELFIARQENRDVTLDVACAAACVPATTAMRWIAHIAEAGFVELRPHRTDDGTKALRLSPLGLARMVDYFSRIAPDRDRTAA